jgi:hypothetical protein
MSLSRIVVFTAAICPDYTAPATTAVPGKPLDGSMTVLAETPTTFFGGAVPPNGFMVQPSAATTGGNVCLVNDNGPATGAGLVSPGGSIAGVTVASYASPAGLSIYVTAPGYKPMGPVSIWCASAGYVAARAW